MKKSLYIKVSFKIIIPLLFTFFFFNGISQNQLNQTIRGSIIDVDTQMPLIGAKVIIVNSIPLSGAISDINGEFKIENVPVGRISLKISIIGYLEVLLQDVLIESVKEKVLNIEMIADVKLLEQVVVSSRKDRLEPINTMATVSAKTFTVEETNRFSGSLNDPARMVSAFAGIIGDSEGDNDIVVRGNSPRGILWRLDGIDIPNPNHFADNGASGGPISALNGALLANSDFFSGAFAPEYGNALSGVFDVKMRKGNNESREYSLSAGVIGVDATIEGPFSKKYSGSYMANYRYSSIALLDKLGILDYGGIPIYQDAAFKLFLPTKKTGVFHLIGLGGKSKINEVYHDNKTNIVNGTYHFKADIGVLGVKHIYIINSKLYVKSYVSANTSFNGGEGYNLQQDSILQLSEREGNRDGQIKLQSILNYKINSKSVFQIGGTYTKMLFQLYNELYNEGNINEAKNIRGQSNFIQSYFSWKYRIGNNISLVSGLHFSEFSLNDDLSIEPRIGLKWRVSPRHFISGGFGKHSRLESISVYLNSQLKDDETLYYPNKSLEMTKSTHYVVGYSYRINENIHFKSEIYFQQLNNVPIAKNTDSKFSFLNYSSGVPDFELENEGKGRNYGVELTIERFFNKNFYYLITGSIFKSQYQLRNETYKDTRYDANFASNILIGKEFIMGTLKNKTIGVNTKVSLIGGNRYTPIDFEASQNAESTVLDNVNPWSQKGDNIFFINLGVTYRCDLKKTSHSFKIDIQNITNNKSTIRQYYNAYTEKVVDIVQQSIIPNLIYTLKF